MTTHRQDRRARVEVTRLEGRASPSSVTGPSWTTSVAALFGNPDDLRATAADSGAIVGPNDRNGLVIGGAATAAASRTIIVYW